MICLTTSCGVAPAPNLKPPGPEVQALVARRAAAVIVTEREHLPRWSRGGFVAERSPGDADGGSAVPVAADGYYLTADHVLAGMAGRNVFIFPRIAGHFTPFKARVVWRSAAGDVALLKIPRATVDYYHWTAADRWLPVGTPVIHGGIATGPRMMRGKLSTSLAPESGLTRVRRFKLDIPLQPGDSGGPVVDAEGHLVGINSAVEFLVPMETAFFVDSEARRPNVRALEALIRGDRARNNLISSSVE